MKSTLVIRNNSDLEKIYEHDYTNIIINFDGNIRAFLENISNRKYMNYITKIDLYSCNIQSWHFSLFTSDCLIEYHGFNYIPSWVSQYTISKFTRWLAGRLIIPRKFIIYKHQFWELFGILKTEDLYQISDRSERYFFEGKVFLQDSISGDFIFNFL